MNRFYFRGLISSPSGKTLIMILLLALGLSVPAVAGEPEARQKSLMRFPDVHGDTVVFVHGEDIWKVSTSGGVAVRLSIHDGEERFPRFSPDGKLIAFTGEYDGNGDVYVMDADGGNITRVTYHPGYDQVVGWHPLSNKILFSSGRTSPSRTRQLFLISADGSGLEPLVLHEAAAGSFSADGKKIAYNKGYREFRTWKRYQGGWAQEVYIFDFAAMKDVNITNFKGTDRAPMWIGDRIYFSSDRDRTLNIYYYDVPTGQISQVTQHADYDVRRPSMGGDRIVYEVGSSLWLLDTKTGKSRQIPVEIRADAPEARPYVKKVDENIQKFTVSPSGKRALITARGEIFTVPKEHGPTRNLTKDSGARDKDAAWSPDGKTIAYLSDKSGEYEMYLVDPKGHTEAVRLTQNRDGYRHTLRWSPDSKKIAFADQTLACYYLDVASKKITLVDRAKFENIDVSLDLKPIYDFAWSPDSRYIAYSKMDQDLVNKIYIYSLETGKIHCVSSGIFNDFGPVFSKDGEHLFFISNRRFSPTYCDIEWEMVYKDLAGIYCLTLKKDGKPLLPFRSDEEEKKAAEPKEAKGKKRGKDKGKDKDEKAVTVRIDFDGLADRIEALPLPAANYRSLTVNGEAVFYLNSEDGDYNRFEFRALGPRDLCAFSFKEREPQVVIKGIDGYDLSFDGSHIIYSKDNSLGIIKSSDKDSKGGPLSLTDLSMTLDPRKEWKQIFNEAWRMERDFYYEPNMHGQNWAELKVKYGRLMELASCRQDVRFIVGELIGELNTSHTYVFGGDRKRSADQVNVGMLGVDWQIDSQNNRYRFQKIYRVPDWSRQVRPPLAGPGIHVNEGDYLLKVNGREVNADRNIYSYFVGLAGKQVTLLVNSQPSLLGAREYTVEPLRGDFALRYHGWVEHNRLLCEKESNGQIGYLHLPDTYNFSATEFPKYFYSQSRKKGLIIDGRFNGGGLDPDIFLHRLDQPINSYWTRRYSHDQTSPVYATRAHMVCLTNRQAGSGGDELPHQFQQRKMGPVIGTRTWGGLVGVSMFIQLIDGGGLTAPDYRIYSEKGEWVVENHGVVPDIVVDLSTEEVARCYDAQLMTGIKYLLKKIKEDPRPWPKHQSFPIDK
jgi:tricorn protease